MVERQHTVDACLLNTAPTTEDHQAFAFRDGAMRMSDVLSSSALVHPLVKGTHLVLSKRKGHVANVTADLDPDYSVAEDLEGFVDSIVKLLISEARCQAEASD